MRTTIELPEELLRAAEREAENHGQAFNELVTEVLRDRLMEPRSGNGARRGRASIRRSIHGAQEQAEIAARVLARMEKGYNLGGQPLSREEVHERSKIR